MITELITLWQEYCLWRVDTRNYIHYQKNFEDFMRWLGKRKA